MTNWYDNVPAPTDANGREVPLDTKELVYKGETRKVLGITYGAHQKCWSVAFGWFDGVDISACTLPDSWEQLERDAGSDTCGYFGDNGEDAHCPDCPVRDGNCAAEMAQDIVRRAKALAGVEEMRRWLAGLAVACWYLVAFGYLLVMLQCVACGMDTFGPMTRMMLALVLATVIQVLERMVG